MSRPPEQPPEGEEEEYDPHVHREVKKPTNNIETLVNVVKGCLGTGILAMPEAYKFSGMINGIISTVMIGVLSTYGLHILVRGQYVMCKKRRVPLLTYPESMKAACEMGPECLRKFAPAAPGLTDFFLVVYQLGCCCVYVVFVGVNVKAVGDEYTKPHTQPLVVYMGGLFIPFILMLCVRNLKLLAPFSVAANFITLVTFAVVAYYVSQDLPPFSDLPAFGNILNYPLFFGTTMFSLQSIGVVVASENNMKTPKSFRGTFGVLNIAMALITIIYIIFAMLGYWKYGEKIESAITLNFPNSEMLSQVIKVLYSIAIYISYGLQGFVAVEILWDNYIGIRIKKRRLLWEYVLRICCVVITFILAISIPLLGLFISLLGVFCLSALSIAFPAIIELCAYWPDELGPCKWVLIKDLALVGVGIFSLLIGSYSCVYWIVKELIQWTF